MFMHKLSVGSLDHDLADKFKVHQLTVSHNTVTWADFLIRRYGIWPFWPSREQVKHFMPIASNKLFPSTRVVVGCTDIAVQAPSSLFLRSEMYSSYQGQTTLKCLEERRLLPSVLCAVCMLDQ